MYTPAKNPKGQHINGQAALGMGYTRLGDTGVANIICTSRGVHLLDRATKTVSNLIEDDSTGHCSIVAGSNGSYCIHKGRKGIYLIDMLSGVKNKVPSYVKDRETNYVEEIRDITCAGVDEDYLYLLSDTGLTKLNLGVVKGFTEKSAVIEMVGDVTGLSTTKGNREEVITMSLGREKIWVSTLRGELLTVYNEGPYIHRHKTPMTDGAPVSRIYQHPIQQGLLICANRKEITLYDKGAGDFRKLDPLLTGEDLEQVVIMDKSLIVLRGNYYTELNLKTGKKRNHFPFKEESQKPHIQALHYDNTTKKLWGLTRANNYIELGDYRQPNLNVEMF